MARSFTNILEEGWESAFSGPDRVRPTILLLGRPEGGKTTLIGTLLDEDIGALDDMGDLDEECGFPTFRGSEYGTPANYLDSPDHTVADDYDDFGIYWADIEAAWKEQAQERPFEKPQVVWYCIPATQKKLERFDYRALRKLRDHPALSGRVAAVITQCDQDKNGAAASSFKDSLAQNVGDDLPVYRVSTAGRTTYDLPSLVEWSQEQLTEEDVRAAFAAEQMGRLRKRKRKAKKAIHGFELTTGSLGALHRWDQETLTAAQCSLARRVIHMYGLDDVLGVDAQTMGRVVATALDESLAGKVLRRTPIVDALSRECCSAAIAVQITRAIGKAVSKMCFERCRARIEGAEIDLGAPLQADEILRRARLDM